MGRRTVPVYTRLSGGMVFPRLSATEQDQYWAEPGFALADDQILPLTRVDMRDCQLLHRDDDVIAIGTPHGEVVVLEGLSQMKPAKAGATHRDEITIPVPTSLGRSSFTYATVTRYFKRFQFGDWMYRLTWFNQKNGWWVAGREAVPSNDGERYGHG